MASISPIWRATVLRPMDGCQVVGIDFIVLRTVYRDDLRHHRSMDLNSDVESLRIIDKVKLGFDVYQKLSSVSPWTDGQCHIVNI